MSRNHVNTPTERLDVAVADNGVISLALFDAVFRHSALGLAVLDRHCCYLRINDWLAKLQGASVASHLGRTVHDMVPALGPQIAAHVDAVLKCGQPVLDDTAREHLGGRSIHLSYFPIQMDGKLAAVGVLVQETTALDVELGQRLSAEREARLHAEQTNRIKDEFLANLGHELRTPLNAIVGWAHMLQNGQLGPVERNRAVDTIVRNAKLQANLVDDLLDVSRIISGKLRLNLERLELGVVVEAAVEGSRPAAAAKGISLSVHIAPNIGEVTGDAHRLQQVIWNVISNAIKFTPRGGRVEVKCERLGDWARVQISDDGQGISKDFLPFLFQRFRQADDSSARRHGGLGLGLAIVRHLVELHSGTVEAFSDGPNLGSTFTIALPAASRVEPRSPETATLGARPTVPAGALVGACVLVVDDEADSRDLLAALLSREGADVLTAASGAQAFEVLRRRIPDVMVCDIGMPEQDGYSFLRQLRTLGEAAGGWVPAVAVTGYATLKDSSEALLSGFQFHVSKPIDPPQVLACIVKLWRRGLRDPER